MSDPRTIAVYDAKAEEYADRLGSAQPTRSMRDFAAALPAGGRVLDLGCGPGEAAAYLRDAGFVAEATDASAGMVAIANARHGLGARQASFEDLEAVAVYDGVWANFSLLHAARADFPRHLAAIRRALKPGGVLHIGMKTGAGEARDSLDRYYTYYSREELAAHLAEVGFTVKSVREITTNGLAGRAEPGIAILARA